MNDVQSAPQIAPESAQSAVPDGARPPRPKEGGAFDRVLTVIGYVCGLFTLFVFGSYFVKITIFPEGTLPVVACALVFAGLIVPFFLRRALRRWLKKLYVPAKALYTFVLLAFTATFIAMCVFIFAPGDEMAYGELPEDPIVVVFGAKVTASGSPGMPLRRRLQKAKEILEARDDALCVVSGGRGDDEPLSEAETMKSWLVSAGIDESRILVEDRARNTLQNVAFSRELLEKAGLLNRPVVCVSSDFHVARIRFISSRTGDFGDYFYRAGGLRAFDWEYFGLAREYLSFARLFLLGTDG